MEFYIVSLLQFMLQFLVHGLVHFIIMIILNTYFMYISFYTTVTSIQIKLGTFQIIGDHKRKSGKFELGTRRVHTRRKQNCGGSFKWMRSLAPLTNQGLSVFQPIEYYTTLLTCNIILEPFCSCILSLHFLLIFTY